MFGLTKGIPWELGLGLDRMFGVWEPPQIFRLKSNSHIKASDVVNRNVDKLFLIILTTLYTMNVYHKDNKSFSQRLN